MVMLDPFNPRSVAFQVEAMNEHLATLPALHDDGMPESRAGSSSPRDRISTEAAESLDNAKLLAFERS